jgi:hypothetical protein
MTFHESIKLKPVTQKGDTAGRTEQTNSAPDSTAKIAITILLDHADDLQDDASSANRHQKPHVDERGLDGVIFFQAALDILNPLLTKSLLNHIVLLVVHRLVCHVSLLKLLLLLLLTDSIRRSLCIVWVHFFFDNLSKIVSGFEEKLNYSSTFFWQ